MNKKYMLGLFLVLCLVSVGFVSSANLTATITLPTATTYTGSVAYSFTGVSLENTTGTGRSYLNGVLYQTYTMTNNTAYTGTWTGLSNTDYSLLFEYCDADECKNSTGVVFSVAVLNCSSTDVTLFAVLSLVFIVGLLYFAITGFTNNPTNLVVFIIGLVLAVIIVGNMSLPLIKGLC